MASFDEVAALKDELARLLADQAASSSDAARQERALEAQLQAITHRESHATNDCAARVAEITTALVSNELSIVDENYVPVDGTAALASTYAGVQAEYTALREEEMQREVRDGRGCMYAAGIAGRLRRGPAPGRPRTEGARCKQQDVDLSAS